LTIASYVVSFVLLRAYPARSRRPRPLFLK